MKIRIFVTALAATLLVAGAALAAPRLVAGAALAAPPLMQKDVIGMPGKEVRVLLVDSPPGASSPVHRHNAQVFVYVLTGKMIMQVAGSPPVTLGPGQTFYEGPEDIHSMSKNASDKEPARLLVFLIMDKEAPVSVPVK
ncbi:MAG: cupin domain-containing protein [bacterium]